MLKLPGIANNYLRHEKFFLGGGCKGDKSF